MIVPSGGLPEVIEQGVGVFVCCNKAVATRAEGLKRHLDPVSLAAGHSMAALASFEHFRIPDFRHRRLAIYEAAL